MSERNLPEWEQLLSAAAHLQEDCVQSALKEEWTTDNDSHKSSTKNLNHPLQTNRRLTFFWPR